MLNALDVGRELIRLKKISDATADGLPDGPGETEAALFDYFLEHFDLITETLVGLG